MRKIETKLRNTKPRKDVCGQKFGYLTAVSWEKGVGWHCICQCGNTTVVDSRNLYNGHTTSCGCKRYETKNLHDLTNYENDALIVVERAPSKSSTKWKCICKRCGKVFTVQAKHIDNCYSCGCITSVNERVIRQMLDKHNVEYAQQYTFSDLYYKSPSHPLRFDFAIFHNGVLSHLIEFNGRQHYERPQGSWGVSFDDLQIRDQLKVQYCSKHNIELRTISWDSQYTIDDLI